MDDDILFKRGKNRGQKNSKVRRGCTVPSPISWPCTKKSHSKEKLATTGSVDGRRVLLETHFVWTHVYMDTAWVLSVGVTFPYGSCQKEARV